MHVGSGTQTFAGWATAISAGPTNEAGQMLAFTVTNNNNALFAAQPTISARRHAHLLALAGAAGTATVTVRLQDDGGTTGGGIDTSVEQTFTITVSAAPTIPPITTQTIAEDGGLTLNFTVTDSVTLPAGLTVRPRAATRRCCRPAT